MRAEEFTILKRRKSALDVFMQLVLKKDNLYA